MKLFEAYAEEIEDMIRTGVLKHGDRLPSVRQASAGRRISPSTVFQAYYLLEARARVVARPRSGYFVAPPKASDALVPQASLPSTATTEVKINDLVYEILGSVRRREVVPLGSAFPSPLLFPLERLSRSLSAGMRRLDPARIVEDLSPGNETLRRQIGLRYMLDGMSVDAGEIVITNGALEALDLCLQAVTVPGDVVAVESPTFYAALQVLERLGLKAVEVATHPRDGIDLASLASVLDRHPVRACWFMPNFQNPLGSLMPETNKRALVELLAARDIPLIEDDVYGELYFTTHKPRPAKSFDTRGLVMHCGSFSKCLAPGYRVGWTAAGQFAQRVERLKLATSISAAVPSQAGISHYLSHGGYDKHLRALRKALADQQAAAIESIVRHFPKGTRITRPDGGYFLWLELPNNVDAMRLHRLALSESISIAPGHIFSADHRFTNCIRLNCGHPLDAQYEAAIRTLGNIAERLARD